MNRKTHAAFAAGLTPIVCVGETLDQRDRTETLAVLDRQLNKGLDGLTADQLTQLVIAYEPVWAIGTGRTATPDAGRGGALRTSASGCSSGSGRRRPRPATSSTAAA